LWITGRAKDLIIRGGHNIDPAEIEDALLSHPAVAFVGAIGQPDSFAGELPCAYVELVAGADVTVDELTGTCPRPYP
jgi:fatty-acyl-CoA synthase